MKKTNKIKFSKNKSKNKNSKRKCKNTKTTKKYKKYNKIRGGSRINNLENVSYSNNNNTSANTGPKEGEIISNTHVVYPEELTRKKLRNNEAVSLKDAQEIYLRERGIIQNASKQMAPAVKPVKPEKLLSETKTLRRSAAPTVRNSSGESEKAETLRKSSRESAEAKTLRNSSVESAVSTAEQSLSGTQKTLRRPAASTIRQLSEESVADTLRSSSKAETLRSQSNVVSLVNSRGKAPSAPSRTQSNTSSVPATYFVNNVSFSAPSRAPSRAPSAASSTHVNRNSMTFTKSSIASKNNSSKKSTASKPHCYK